MSCFFLYKKLNGKCLGEKKFHTFKKIYTLQVHLSDQYSGILELCLISYQYSNNSRLFISSARKLLTHNNKLLQEEKQLSVLERKLPVITAQQSIPRDKTQFRKTE